MTGVPFQTKHRPTGAAQLSSSRSALSQITRAPRCSGLTVASSNEAIGKRSLRWMPVPDCLSGLSTPSIPVPIVALLSVRPASTHRCETQQTGGKDSEADWFWHERRDEFKWDT